MTKRVTQSDWEALSAYLDDELSRNERARLENKLQTRPDLCLALEDIRKTRTILRSQPSIRARRNFTLTPEMVGMSVNQRSTFRMYPTFRLATVIASVLFIMVLVGDFLLLSPGGLPSRMAVERSPDIVAMEAAIEQAVEKEMEIIAEESEESETGDIYFPTEIVESAVEESEGRVEMAPEMEVPLAAEPGSPPAEEESAIFAEEEAIVETPTSTPSPTPVPTSVPVEGIEGETASLEVISEEGERPVFLINWTPWRISEFLLAIIAISTGLIAIYLKWAGRA